MKKILLLFFIILQFSYGYINIHPISFDKRIDGDGSYQEYSLFNQTDKTIFYRIYVEPNPNDLDMSMDKWINFYPRSLTLEPGESGIIKVHIASYGDIPEGEYSAILGLREIPVYEEEISENQSAVSIYTDFKIVLNGYAGDIAPYLKFENLKVEETDKKVLLKGKVENIGDRQGKYKIYLDEYFLGNLRINKGDSLKFEENDFYFLKDKNYKKYKKLIIKDYETDEEIESIKLK